MGEIIGIIIVGAIVGALARLFMKGEQPIGVLWTIILGALGAWVGTWIASLLGVADTNGIDWIEWIISILVAIGFISVYLGIQGRSKRV
ncbi:MAG TPA: GlsB/YeaQ/YmgE family stress response membrane protein [Intrasporangiaceae bacterium]|nr:GlsB/YeaQ/YmgE family stress response membrane protein [Intrasporangiaceae bacterium]